MAMNCTLIVHSYWFDTCTWQLAHAQPLRSHGCLAAAAASSSRRVQVSQHCATHGYGQELSGCTSKQERKSSEPPNSCVGRAKCSAIDQLAVAAPVVSSLTLPRWLRDEISNGCFTSRLWLVW